MKETKQVGWFLKPPSSPASLMQHRVKNVSHSCSGCRIYTCGFECRLLGNLSVPLSTKCREMALIWDTFKMSIHIHVGTCAERCALQVHTPPPLPNQCVGTRVIFYLLVPVRESSHAHGYLCRALGCGCSHP